MNAHFSTQGLSRVAISFLAACSLVSCIAADLQSGIANSDSASCHLDNIKSDLFRQPKFGIAVAAHRASHEQNPENSIAAIRAAIEDGIDIVEIDVHVSSDGVPMLMHDDQLMRTTNHPGNVGDFSRAALSEINLLAPDGSVSDEKIPTLRNALGEARGRIFVNIDVKSSNVDAIVNVISSLGMEDGVMFYSSDPEVRARIRTLLPNAVAMPIARSKVDVADLIATEPLTMLHLDETYNDPSIARLLDEKGIAGWTNALGKADEFAVTRGPDVGYGAIIANHPDVIQTDHPLLLLDFLKAKGLHWSNRARCE